MTLIIEPEAGEDAGTTRIAPEKWNIDEEWIEIAAYLSTKTLEAAQTAGTVTIQEQSKPARNEFKVARYQDALFKAQLRDWRMQAPESVTEHPSTRDLVIRDASNGRLYWRFCEAVMKRLPWDLRTWLEGQIQQCGGVIPTRLMITRTDDGQKTDYKSQDPPLGAGQAS